MVWQKGQSGNPDKCWKPGQSGNAQGRKRRTITQFIREYGEAHTVEVDITKTVLKNEQEETTRIKINLSTTDKKTSINAAIAAKLMQGAMEGNLDCIKEVIDRSEGKAVNAVIEEDKPEYSPPIIHIAAYDETNIDTQTDEGDTIG